MSIHNQYPSPSTSTYLFNVAGDDFHRTVNDPDYGQQWHHEFGDHDIGQTWRATTGRGNGARITVAVVKAVVLIITIESSCHWTNDGEIPNNGTMTTTWLRRWSWLERARMMTT